MCDVIGVCFVNNASFYIQYSYLPEPNVGDVFQAYDYGEKGNLLAYGSKKPLIYDLQNVTAPVFKKNKITADCRNS